VASVARRIIGWPRLAPDSTGIEDHEAPADAGEVALYLEVFSRHVAGTNLLQESGKLGNVPLAIPEFIRVSCPCDQDWWRLEHTMQAK
jgi:hypothetical protein